MVQAVPPGLGSQRPGPAHYAPAHEQSHPALPKALAEALAVYYFPGMWAWRREIVQPLVHQALDRASGNEPTDAVAAAHALLDRYAAWATERTGSPRSGWPSRSRSTSPIR